MSQTTAEEYVQKSELIYLHSLLVQVKNYLIESSDKDLKFENYSDIETGPLDVHEPKAKHKHAILILGKEIADAMVLTGLDGSEDISRRMGELIDENNS